MRPPPQSVGPPHNLHVTWPCPHSHLHVAVAHASPPHARPLCGFARSGPRHAQYGLAPVLFHLGLSLPRLFYACPVAFRPPVVVWALPRSSVHLREAAPRFEDWLSDFRCGTSLVPWFWAFSRSDGCRSVLAAAAASSWSSCHSAAPSRCTPPLSSRTWVLWVVLSSWYLGRMRRLHTPP